MSNQILLCDIEKNDIIIAWYPEFKRWIIPSFTWLVHEDNSDLIIVGVIRKGLFYTTDKY